MIKIGFVHNVSEIGGAERMTQTIIANIDKQKFSSAIICPDAGPMIRESSELNATPHVIAMPQPEFTKPFSSIKGYLKWNALMRQQQFDVIHTGDLICTRSLLKAANKNQIPVVCHIHFPFKRNFAEWVFNKQAQPAAFIFCSQELQNDVGPMLKEICPSAVQHVVHNGVNTEKFAPISHTNSVPRVGIIANLQERKGHFEFLHMAKELLDQGIQAQFDIIGGDILAEPREELLKNLCKELSLQEHVTFHGQVSNVLALLQQLDIVVCASYQEAFPVSILEAMACEKPVVSTNVNGIPEAIVEGETGFMVPAKDSSALARQVKKLLDDNALQLQMGKAARQRVECHFSEQSYISKIEQIYHQLKND
ncbi:glycosyltransferase [Catenovulum sp. SX2]|uniref:glycosyltransferase n=1 Tax=Catenovulum sp. SX2 TaxID=3398614 RepID=UPI003F828564